MGGKPGDHNDLTDIPGITVGQAQDPDIRTGVTVVLPEQPAIVAGDVRGGGPGTRETDLLNASTLVDRADAVVLSGGSSYGLAAADGVSGWLGARGRGFQLVKKEGVPPSPIVPAAILYDLSNGGKKDWGETPPYAALGAAACEAATAEAMALGKAGAGFGALSGAERGGLGAASFVTDDGWRVAAAVAVNSFGSTRIPRTDAFWSWPFEIGQEFGGIRPYKSEEQGFEPAVDLALDTKLAAPSALSARANTTIGVVALSATLHQSDAERIAVMAQDGIARAIRPVHGPTDGDALFVLATDGPTAADPLTITRLGSIAADCVARAIARGVFEAAGG
ncbi:MAG: P1 family peptidase [Pseudomonadota bacterium]